MAQLKHFFFVFQGFSEKGACASCAADLRTYFNDCTGGNGTELIDQRKQYKYVTELMLQLAVSNLFLVDHLPSPIFDRSIISY